MQTVLPKAPRSGVAENAWVYARTSRGICRTHARCRTPPLPVDSLAGRAHGFAGAFYVVRRCGRGGHCLWLRRAFRRFLRSRGLFRRNGHERIRSELSGSRRVLTAKGCFFGSVLRIGWNAVRPGDPDPPAFRVLVVVAIIVFGKFLAAFLLVLAFRYPLNTALTVSASLAQIGEFSFILAGLGVSLGSCRWKARASF